MSETTAATETARAAARYEVVDALHFRRLSPTRWAHLGGFGRGTGWAGLVDLDTEEEPLLAQMPARPGGVHRFEHEAPAGVLGLYYAVSGAVVRVSRDVAVVVANPTGCLTPGTTEDELRAVATWVDADVEEVSPSELEVLHAVRAITTGEAADLSGTLQHIVTVAVDALSSDADVLRDARCRRSQVRQRHPRSRGR